MSPSYPDMNRAMRESEASIPQLAPASSSATNPVGFGHSTAVMDQFMGHVDYNMPITHSMAASPDLVTSFNADAAFASFPQNDFNDMGLDVMGNPSNVTESENNNAAENGFTASTGNKASYINPSPYFPAPSTLQNFLQEAELGPDAFQRLRPVESGSNYVGWDSFGAALLEPILDEEIFDDPAPMNPVHEALIRHPNPKNRQDLVPIVKEIAKHLRENDLYCTADNASVQTLFHIVGQVGFVEMLNNDIVTGCDCTIGLLDVEKGLWYIQAQKKKIVRRPMNAWICFRSAFWNSKRLVFPDYSLSKCSHEASLKWRSFSTAEKQPWFAEARAIQATFAIAHPGYKFKPRRSQDIPRRKKMPSGPKKPKTAGESEDA